MSRTIILSYGLQDRLRATLDRARRHGTPIHLVAAVPSAARGLRRHRSSLVTVHDEIGRAGLTAALGQDDAVLLLHEDVLLDPAGASRLLELAVSHGGVVAPRTNHADVDGATGTLPPDVVQPLGPPVAPRRVSRVRSVCLAGSSADLRRLLPHRLTAASTRLHTEGRFLLAPDVTATHLDEGRDQLEPPVGPDGRPLLVAAMIVRDEERFLEDCLASLEGLVDRVEICDTGSTDATVRIAREAGANVSHVEWRDDFAWARNQVLERCRDAWWVLHVDADERVRTADPEALRRFLATALADAEGFDVPLDNIGIDGESLGGQQLPRIFPAADTVYAGRVHEVAQRRDGTMLNWSVLHDLEIEHHGYRPDVVDERDKRQRNLDLARADHDRDGSPRTTLQLLRALGAFGNRDEELRDLSTGLLELIREGRDQLNEAGQIPVYQLHSRACFRLGEHEEAWQTISEGLDAHPGSTVLRAQFGEIGNRTGHAAEVAARLGTETTDDEARPWTDAFAAAGEATQLALSQLASDDLDAAGGTIRALLASGVPSGFERWDDIVAVVALSRADEAIDLLLPPAAADGSAAALAAVLRVLEPTDAATFAVSACGSAAAPSRAQRDAAYAAAARADDVGAVEELTTMFAPDTDYLASVVPHGGPRLAAWYRRRTGETDVFDLDGALADLRAGRSADEALVTHLATAPTMQSMYRLVREVPPAVAARVATRAVLAGADQEAAVRAALTVITVADDADAATQISHLLHRVDGDVVRILRQRAKERGADSVAAVLDAVLEDDGQRLLT